MIKCSPIPNTDRYRLLEQITIRDKTIPIGFEWDGASIPQPFWSILGLTPHHPSVMRASLYHDYEYNRSALDDVADKNDRVFMEILIEDGVSRNKAEQMHWAVQIYRGPRKAETQLSIGVGDFGGDM